MAASGVSTNRSGRPRKASSAALPLPLVGTPTLETSAPSAAGGGPSLAHPSYSSVGPTTVAECEALAAQLLDPSTPVRRRQEIAVDLRDSAESNREHSFYHKYLGIFIPVLVKVLGNEDAIVFVKDNAEQRFRHALYALVQRLPHSEPFRPHENTVMELMLKLLKVENEENALLCIKIIIDGFRAHKEQAEVHVEPFLQLVKEMYANTKSIVEKEFGSPEQTAKAQAQKGATASPAPTPITPSTAGEAQPPPQGSSSSSTALAHALHSPKVLTECPIAVVLIFQTYKSVMGQAMLDFYPLVMESIKMQPEAQRLAHLEAKERGELFVGVASGITNREMYTELLKAQVKTMAFLAYVLRGPQAINKDYLDIFPEACLRLLRDCPPEDIATRKELLVATRHILSADSRTSFIPYIESLLDERVLVGTGISSRETLRPLAYSVVADLIHHVRDQLPLPQLAHIIYVFSCCLNDSSYSSSIQTMCAKLLNTLADSVHSKGDSVESSRIMRSLFFSSLEKLVAMTEAHDRLKALHQRDKGKGKAKEVISSTEDVVMEDEELSDRKTFGWREIEQTMPVHAVSYAYENLETFCKEARFLYKTLLHTFRTLLTYTRQGDNPSPPPDGELMAKLFRHAIKALGIFEGNRDAREVKDANEIMSQILLLFGPHTFSEIWTNHMDFFFEETMNNIHVFPLLQMLIVHESVSKQLVGILLKWLMGRLSKLSELPHHAAAVTLRLFKTAFLAINTYIASNEAVLVPHLQKLILNSFSYAAKAKDPAIYYQILRALFRSIGGGRFEALYKEVLPILQEMLDTLAYLLQYSADDSQRDLFVELTLTVPVRLTNLLPHLSYLMKPLVHALQGGPEQVNQGLRTLELCIDNLTADFLDPTMGPVLRDLMTALHKLLKPIPGNRVHSHAAIKILGKLGGRNRRFFEVDYHLDYRGPASDMLAPMPFEGKVGSIPLAPIIAAAGQALEQDTELYWKDSLELIMNFVLTIFQEDAPSPEGNEVFQKAMSSLFLACGKPPLSEKASAFVRDFCRRTFALELNRTDAQPKTETKFTPDQNRKRYLPLMGALSDIFVNTFANAKPAAREGLGEILAMVVQDFRALATGPEFGKKIDGSRAVDRMVHTFARSFVGLCHEEDWARKMAGVAAMNVFTRKIELSRKLIVDFEIEFIRALLFCLRDAPKDTPGTSEEVIDLMKHLIRTCHTQEDARSKKLADSLVTELNSQSKLSRNAAQQCIEVLAETLAQPITDVIGSAAKTRLLDAQHGPIYAKPLRALPFPMQVGNIEAVVYLIDLKTLIEPSDEFIRLLQEILALADVEDSALVGKPSTHKQENWLKAMRISCLRFLRSTMVVADLLGQQNHQAVRSRIIQVYFKHVYSPDSDIVEVAHQGLRNVLQQQNKLPKEVLQAGLRPILVNLADAKRLSVSGLDGLARFLELLTSYFKVEIGVKLIDHFDALGEPNMLRQAAFSPLEDNVDIARMARLVNIFRLLPSSSVQYLKSLTTHVVDVEAHLHQSAPGPFTINMARYLDKYHNEGAQNLLDNIRNPRYIWTYRNIIASGQAPTLVEVLSRPQRAQEICHLCFDDPEAVEFVVPGLYLIREFTRTSPSWLSEREEVLEAVVTIWRSILDKSRDKTVDMSSAHYQQMSTLILEMFMNVLKNGHERMESSTYIELLFHVVEAFEIRSPFERSSISFFLYQQVALHESVEHRREVVDHYFILYDEEKVSWAFKTNALRLIVNPTLRMCDGEKDAGMITPQLILKVAVSIWRPWGRSAHTSKLDDDLLIEIFDMSTLLIEHFSKLIVDVRKDVFKVAWMGINLLEPTVKLNAYMLTAKFMAAFDTPTKFVRLTWIGLIRLKESDNRALFRKAVATMADCMPKRDPPQPGATAEWATRVRTILVEEGHATSQQLITICELLVNHPDLFYDYRELYVPHIANSLSKLAFLQASTMEHKRLTVDIVELIFKWERKRMAARDSDLMEVDGEGPKRATDTPTDPSPHKRQRLDRAGTAASSSKSGAGWVAPPQVRELLTTHLLRLVAQSNEPLDRGGLVRRALDLFKDILGPQGLPNVHVKLAFFTRTMTQPITGNAINMIANSAEVIAAVAVGKDEAWVRQNLEILTKILERAWVYDDAGLHETIKDLTEQMFRELPDDENAEAPAPAKAMLEIVQNAVNDGLNSGLKSSAALPGTLFLLRTWLKAKPKMVLQPEPVGSGLLKVLANLTKLHTNNGPDPAHRLIISVLDIIKDRVSDLKDHRKHLMSILGALVDRSTNISLCRYVLDMVRDWIVNDPDLALGKERASLLLRMAVYEQRDAGLFERYLDVVYDIYELDQLRGTDITHKLEAAFLLGARSTIPAQRTRFLDKLEQSLPRSLDSRLQYLFSLQNWETLAESYWIPQILSMLLGVVDQQDPLIRRALTSALENDPVVEISRNIVVGDLITPVRNLIHANDVLAHKLWIGLFPLCWAALTRGQQTAFTGYIVKLLSKEYHCKQVEARPNVIQTFLGGILPCVPAITLPPMLIKYLAKNFNAWYTGFEILTRLSDVYRPDDDLRDSCANALGELYAELCEDDMFYGLARSRCVYPETTAALTYEQNGQWPKAIEMYEQAQLRARNGLLPFSEEEYGLWEDHWILVSQKLQSWESLSELAKVDQDPDLLLECAWRLVEWSTPDREVAETSLARVIDAPTPRRKTFETFNSLLKSHLAREVPNDFIRLLDETEQVTLRKWISLPTEVTGAHLPLLQMFQQCVELGEASQILDSLTQTNASNLEVRVNSDLKSVFGTWRDRLPNFWDDIMVWSDLLAWRQHIFQSVTRVYVPLIPPGETATYGFRGYHETAWMINRFGEVARRHGLLDVCSVALNKIYALPNIEISEAFLKLREQAMCFFQKPDKFNDGLENISTTNLVYFAPSQKAEFLTLKGMFISRLGQNEEANAEFAHAIQMDMTLPKAWAEWGRFNDKLYRERSETPETGPPDPKAGEPRMTEDQWFLSYARDRALLASSAVSCYLQAAGLYNSHKSRGLLLRVLWLLGLDDSNNTIAKAFENYKGDLVVWYWITLIPQLILSLSHREAKQARVILTRIAKSFPQALFYHLRVSREDFSNVKRSHLAARAANAKRVDGAKGTTVSQNGDAKPSGSVEGDGKEAKGDQQSATGVSENGSMPPPSAQVIGPRQPWELTDELMNLLKTSFPLLTLTMEKMVDQISLRAKPASDEDIYRFFAALLADALVQWGGRSGVPNDDGELNLQTRENLAKFANNLQGDLRASIEKDFMTDLPKLRDYIKRLQWWRDMYEQSLDVRPRTQPLDAGGCNLTDFHHTKFDEIEIPGQYVHHVEQTEEFVKIARFLPKVELGRGHGHCFRRITMIGTNGSSHTFNVQMPAARHCRREERLTQLFRIMNSVLRKRKESRRRNLQFHLPTAIALAPQLRLVQNNNSYISLQDVLDSYCHSRGATREDSIMAFFDRVKQLHDPALPRNDNRFYQLKAEIMEEMQAKLVPETILTDYMIKSMNSAESLWLMRKQFAMQTAAVSFLTFVCCLSNRAPSRFHLSRKTGQMYMTEILPAFAQGSALISSSESVPFRLTPNMQHFITRVGIEGVLTASDTAIARSLTMPEFDLAGTLSLFIRDEILTWHNTYMKEPQRDQPLTAVVYKNVDAFIRRASLVGYLGDNKDKTQTSSPMVHVIVTLVSQATSPLSLAQMGENFMAWF